ncbi:N-acetylglucosamine kinase [Spelaeicoccus albus]|uniref:N-acetylglucosamine kinase-like BadF-type ATPase n=1 Tax=Spelaeicoccus albus TaxID=1280376 RepID=A0A7Z0CZD6_9MICO|nr:BadF/BadG/BcrA/BcrD ATPase family protein [Spelaeicoccus albus]NYI66174.1 N-acetylglucosamine kinase-like BadF-type ATPase [Spelaeicoccus albus]
MTESTHAHTGTTIGLDIGGTKTHAVLIESDVIVREAVAGSANTQSVTRSEAEANLREAYAELGSPDVNLVCAGSAGVDTDADQQRLIDLIRPSMRADDAVVVHDTHLILAAAGLDAGIGVVWGTGTAAWGMDAGGREARSGGWGYLLGDEGSGYWVVIQAVRHALRRMDAGDEPDEMTAELLRACGLTDPGELIHLAYSDADRRFWAGKAPLVFRAASGGNAAARSIVEAGIDGVAGMIASVSGNLAMPGPVVLVGGVATHQPEAVDGLRERLGAAADVRVLDVDPVIGTIRLAAAHRNSAL